MLFTDADCQTRLKPFLYALAHVEENTHQGSLELHERLLSPRHWSAVGSLGAAHLLAGQDPPHPFDQQQVPRCLYNFFLVYLCAALQRQTLQRLLWDTDQAILEAEGRLEVQLAKLRKLHQDMLHFSVQACFTEVSHRETHNQYYGLSLQGLRVEQALQRVVRVLHDLEAAATVAFQLEANRDTQKLAGDVGSKIRVLADVRQKIEWLEVLFVSYFATAFAYYVGNGLFANDYAHWSMVAAPFVSGLLALRYIKPYASHPGIEEGLESHEPVKKTGGGKPAKKLRGLMLLGLLSLLALGWVAIGHFCFPKVQHFIDGQSFLCASESDCKRETSEGTI